jgi:CRP/FNR family transcriptional regulator, cyclic AMP receptor protein
MNLGYHARRGVDQFTHGREERGTACRRRRPRPRRARAPSRPFRAAIHGGRDAVQRRGAGALLDEETCNSTAVALTDGAAIALDRGTLRTLVEHHPSVAARVVEQLVRRLRDAEDQIEVMMLRDNQSKVVSSLLKLAHRAAGAAEIAMSPVELSTRVGLDVETVKRVVQRLRDQQYVRIQGERIEIVDVDALRRLYVLLGTKDELRGDVR